MCWQLLLQLFQNPDIYQWFGSNGMIQIVLRSNWYQRAILSSSKALWDEQHKDVYKRYQTLPAAWAKPSVRREIQRSVTGVGVCRITKISSQSGLLISAFSGMAVISTFFPYMVHSEMVPIQRSKCQQCWKSYWNSDDEWMCNISNRCSGIFSVCQKSS